MPDTASLPAKGSKNMEDVIIPQIEKGTVVQDIIGLCPATADVMAAYGLHCFSCSVGGVESLEEGCQMHGFDDETIDALVDDLNDTLRSQPVRPQELILTKDAALAIENIAKSEGHEKEGLVVIADGHGGFCMEFRKEREDGDMVFHNEEVQTVWIYASQLTLWHIGGATIDFREDRFKLDLPEDNTGSCCNSNDDKCCCSKDGN